MAPCSPCSQMLLVTLAKPELLLACYLLHRWSWRFCLYGGIVDQVWECKSTKQTQLMPMIFLWLQHCLQMPLQLRDPSLTVHQMCATWLCWWSVWGTVRPMSCPNEQLLDHRALSVFSCWVLQLVWSCYWKTPPGNKWRTKISQVYMHSKLPYSLKTSILQQWFGVGSETFTCYVWGIQWEENELLQQWKPTTTTKSLPLPLSKELGFESCVINSLCP